MTGKRDAKSGDWMNRCVLTTLVVLLFAMLITGVVAKYVYRNGGMNMVISREFYFTSNLLKENGANYILNPNVSEITFTLGNHRDALRWAEDDISYQITVSGEATVNETSGTLVRQTDKTTVKTITLSGLLPGKTYTVTATGKAGYKKVLSATFTVGTNQQKVYKYLDTTNDAYVLLTVWTENVAGNLQFQFPAGLIPDNTDPIMEEITNFSGEIYNSGNVLDGVSLAAINSSRTYRFFKGGAGIVTADDFTVQLQDAASQQHVADIGTP